VPWYLQPSLPLPKIRAGIPGRALSRHKEANMSRGMCQWAVDNAELDVQFCSAV